MGRYLNKDNSEEGLLDKQSKFILLWTSRAACTAGVSLFKEYRSFDQAIKKYP